MQIETLSVGRLKGVDCHSRVPGKQICCVLPTIILNPNKRWNAPFEPRGGSLLPSGPIHCRCGFVPPPICTSPWHSAFNHSWATAVQSNSPRPWQATHVPLYFCNLSVLDDANYSSEGVQPVPTHPKLRGGRLAGEDVHMTEAILRGVIVSTSSLNCTHRCQCRDGRRVRGTGANDDGRPEDARADRQGWSGQRALEGCRKQGTAPMLDLVLQAGMASQCKSCRQLRPMHSLTSQDIQATLRHTGRPRRSLNTIECCHDECLQGYLLVLHIRLSKKGHNIDQSQQWKNESNYAIQMLRTGWDEYIIVRHIIAKESSPTHKYRYWLDWRLRFC